MNRFLSDGRLSLNSLLTVGFLTVMACAGAGASIIPISNPTFTATLDQPITWNAVNYNTGDPIPRGTYIAGNGSGVLLRDESTGLGAVGSDTASFPGWITSSPRAGAMHPSETTSGLTDSGDVGYVTTRTDVDGGVTSLSQDLGIPFLSNATYTLSIDLLDKGVVAVSPVFYVDLTAGGTRMNGTQVIVNPTQATLGSDVVTFTAGAIAPVGDLGIVIHAQDTSGNLTQLLVDNASLTVTPEPASLGMLAMGGAMMLSRRRRNS